MTQIDCEFFGGCENPMVSDPEPFDSPTIGDIENLRDKLAGVRILMEQASSIAKELREQYGNSKPYYLRNGKDPWHVMRHIQDVCEEFCSNELDDIEDLLTDF